MPAKSHRGDLASAPAVITGCGWVTPFAAGVAEAVAQAPGATGFTAHRVPAHVPCRDAKQQPRAAAWSTDAPAPPVHIPVPDAILAPIDGIPEDARRERPVYLAAAALRIALQDAQLDPREFAAAKLASEQAACKPLASELEACHPLAAKQLASRPFAAERVGLAIGCALAGQSGMIDFAEDVRKESARFVSPIRFPQTVGNYPAGALARAFGLRGPSLTVACGSASALAAIQEAIGWIRDGAADAVIAGGVEVFSAALAAGLAEESADDTRPFIDSACLFVIERHELAASRGAPRMIGIDAVPDHAAGASEAAAGSGSAATGSAGSVGQFGDDQCAATGVELLEVCGGRSLAASGAGALAAAMAQLARRPDETGSAVICCGNQEFRRICFRMCH